MVVAVRHGQTDLNAAKGGGEVEHYRGNLQISINADGEAEAREAAGKIGMPVKAVISDSMPRDFQTAAIIAQVTKAPHLLDERLAPWDIGLLSGKTKREVTDLVDFFVQNPDLEVPEGEAFGDFYKRQKSAILDYIEQDDGDPHGAIVIVLQGSSFRSVAAMANDDDWSLIESTTERVPTGDVEWLT